MQMWAMCVQMFAVTYCLKFEYVYSVLSLCFEWEHEWVCTCVTGEICLSIVINSISAWIDIKKNTTCTCASLTQVSVSMIYSAEV